MREERGRARLGRAVAAAGLALCLASAPAPFAVAGVPPPPAAIADGVAEGLVRERLDRGLPPLERRGLLDRVALARAEGIAALPEALRFQYPRSLEDDLRGAGLRRFRRARSHLDLQQGAPDPAAAALGWWKEYASAWEEAMDPAMDGLGAGAAVAPDGWLVLVTILVEDEVLPEDVGPWERATEQAIDRERVDHGLPPLAPSAAARELARMHSADMARRAYFEHASPEGLVVADRAAARGVAFRKIAENISRVQGMDDPVRVAVEGWMASPGHRANILDPEMVEAGVGIAIDEAGRVYFTQVFLRPASAR